MHVSQLNESELLARIIPLLPVGRATIEGSGDDSAVFRLAGDATVSTDVLVEDRHFRREWSTGFDVGFRAAQQNIADALAMGARPVSLVVGLGLPSDTEVAWVEDFASGLAAACSPWGIGVDGGDLVGCSEITVSVTVLGDLEGRNSLLRRNALPGHLLVFAGNLGHGLAGYELLRAGFTREDPNHAIAGLIDDFLRPKPPVERVLQAIDEGVLESLMDVSDGLVRDIGRISRASRMWIDLHGEALNRLLGPLAVAAGRLGADRRYWALAGGEDHGFVGTISPQFPVPQGFDVIGQVIGPDEHGRLTLDHALLNPDQYGWDHFRV